MADTLERRKYVFNLTAAANARLDLQHYQVLQGLDGHLLDPSIDYKQPNLKIADVCSGTGIWLLSLKPDPTTELHALDINLSNMPPEPWLPNIIRHVYNINDPPPPELTSAFDIVNLAMAITFIPDKDFDKVFSNVFALLKPGGHIQWTDIAQTRASSHSPDPSYEPQHLNRMWPQVWDMFHMTCPTWPAELDDAFRRNGVVDVKALRPEVDFSMMRTWTEQICMVWEETLAMHLKYVGESEESIEKNRNFKESLEKSYDEIKTKGCGTWTPIVRAVGRKAIE